LIPFVTYRSIILSGNHRSFHAELVCPQLIDLRTWRYGVNEKKKRERERREERFLLFTRNVLDSCRLDVIFESLITVQAPSTARERDGPFTVHMNFSGNYI